MTDAKPRSKILDRILKLFALGTEGRNTSEEETLAAMTKAKALMAQHNISMGEVEAGVSGRTDASHIKWNIRHHQTYTRKMRNFASYDNNVMWAIAKLTETVPVIRQTVVGGQHYVHLVFVGDEADVAVAAELYMLILEAVRRAARHQYGAGWSARHTAYALGFGHRLIDRATQMVDSLNRTDANTLALVVASKAAAIKEALAHVKQGKRRKAKVDVSAYSQGYQDGGSISLGKNQVKGG